MKLNAKEVIKILLSRTQTRQKDLAQILTEKTGKKYTAGSLAQKIARGTISYNEVVLIADMLGFDININQRNI